MMRFNHFLEKSFFLYLAEILTVFGLVQAWILTFYYQYKFNEWISWQANDYSGNYFSIGRHYFSDFLHLVIDTPDGEVQYPLATYPPFANLVFRIFAFFPYKFSLFVWLACLLFAMIWPIYYALRSVGSVQKLHSISIFAILAAPFIAVLDRGNSIGFVVILVFLFYVALEKNKRFLAGLFLGVAISLKIYPLFLVPFLITRKKYIESVFALVITAILNVLATLVWSSKSLIGTIVHQYESLQVNNSVVQTGHGMNYSGVQILENFVERTNLRATSLINDNVEIISIILLLLLIAGSYVSSHKTWTLYGLYAFQLIPAVSWSYSRVWTLTGIAILIYTSRNYEINKNWKTDRVIWWIIILLNQSILTILIWPINLLPSLSFLICYLLTFSNLIRFWMSKIKLHNLGVNSPV